MVLFFELSAASICRFVLAGSADHEPLGGYEAFRVGPAGRAVARRAARHRFDLGEPARVQGTQARHPDRLVPRPGGMDRPLGRPDSPGRHRQPQARQHGRRHHPEAPPGNHTRP